MEGEGFRAGVAFLERIVQSQVFERSDDLGKGLKTALVRERAALAKWEQEEKPISDMKR
jgi:hypothetical protein